MNIEIYVIGQDLRVKDGTTIRYASGTTNFIQFRFVSMLGWENLTLYATLTQNGVARDVYLDDNHTIFLPSAIVPGSCSLVLRGVNGNTIVATTNVLQLTVGDSGVIDDVSSTDITPTLYQQLVAMVLNVATVDETERFCGINLSQSSS